MSDETDKLLTFMEVTAQVIEKIHLHQKKQDDAIIGILKLLDRIISRRDGPGNHGEKLWGPYE